MTSNNTGFFKKSCNGCLVMKDILANTKTTESKIVDYELIIRGSTKAVI